MARGIELWSINRWLRKVGLVFVIAVPTEGSDEPTRLWIQTAKKYDEDCKRPREDYFTCP